MCTKLTLYFELKKRKVHNLHREIPKTLKIARKTLIFGF